MHLLPHLSLHRFPHLVRLPLLRCYILRRVHPLPSARSVMLLADWQSPVTSLKPKSLIEVSSEHTPINLVPRKGGPDTNLDDLAITVDASEIHNTADVGRLASLFSQSTKQVSVSCSQTQSSVVRPCGTQIWSVALGDQCEMLSLFQFSRNRC